MQTYTLTQIRYMSGIDTTDDAFLQEIKMQAWLGERKYRVIQALALDSQREKAIQDGIEILIIKE